jgi:hypothetical protein
MTVYTLLGTYVDGTSNVVGIYSTEDKAYEAQLIIEDETEESYDEYVRTAFEIDAPPLYKKEHY